MKNRVKASKAKSNTEIAKRLACVAAEIYDVSEDLTAKHDSAWDQELLDLIHQVHKIRRGILKEGVPASVIPNR